MKRTIWFLLLLAAFITACSPAAAQSTSTGGGQPKGNTGAWTLTLNRSGGIGGVHQTWQVSSTGQVMDEKGQAVAADLKKLATLIDVVNKTDFTQFQADYRKGSRCNDCFQFQLTLEQDGVSHTVTMLDDPNVQTPAALRNIIDQVLSLVMTQQQ